MNNNYLLKTESSIKRTLSDIIQNEVKNNIGFVTITDVSLTSDYSYLTVYYTVLSMKDKKKAKEGLESSKGFIRTALASRVKMRKVPEIVFKLDTSYDNASRIEDLIKEIHKD
ncbi:MAG: 30S ribosome-binding factor RbfA [Bacillales bacterium]|nr:30S ribosome-binding factor RbfA [Bacillales bacterium]